MRTLLLEAAAQHSALVRALRSTPGSDPATVHLEPTLVIRGGGSALMSKSRGSSAATRASRA